MIKLITCLWLVGVCYGASTLNGEARIMKDLLENYSVDARPVLNDTDKVNVKMDLELNQVIDIIEKNEQIDVFFFIRQFWKDEHLTWNKSEYNNVESIHVSPQKIWKPDIILYNNIENDKKFGGSLDQLNNRVIIKYTGEVTWLTPALLIAKCPMNIKYFPFDEQKCVFEFGSWTYDGSQVNIDVRNSEMSLTSYTENSEWELKGTSMVQINKTYSCCPGVMFPVIHATVMLHRKPLYYLLNMIFPMVLISILTTLVFFLPAESGERVGLAITLFLSMTVFMLIVDSLMPETSDTVPILIIFFGVSFMEMVCIIITTCIILKMHSADYPLPSLVRRFLYDNWSFKVGIRKKSKVDPLKAPQSSDENQMMNGAKQNGGYFHGESVKKLSRVQLIKESETNQNLTASTNQSVQLFSKELSKKIDLLVDRFVSEEESDQIKNEWKVCAYTLDRIMLVAFLIAFIVTVLCCFVTASIQGEE